MDSLLIDKILHFICSLTLLFCSEFQWMIKNFSEVETHLRSVERLDQYSTLEQEPALESSPDKKPSSDLPQKGNSSIIGALFRMYNYQGKIIIDNVNIDEIGLHDLSKKFVIIPQDPTLSTDLLNENEDSVLWDVLKQTQLDKEIENMNEGLESKISDSGSNFSAGLRKSKILVLDEATVNCDFKID